MTVCSYTVALQPLKIVYTVVYSFTFKRYFGRKEFLIEGHVRPSVT
jgi:hypothetical protein